ncbi:hypothetical protein PIB30_085142 [Stylosanthes scabra]|uniref:Uncharacterized protein n=1 Tax=Stylosanthes scabra TaxID=79078 RepID=A0ABU6ZRC2_9FABA|nr:hypothetical protein [Stylosanthes scabra]
MESTRLLPKIVLCSLNNCESTRRYGESTRKSKNHVFTSLGSYESTPIRGIAVAEVAAGAAGGWESYEIVRFRCCPHLSRHYDVDIIASAQLPNTENEDESEEDEGNSEDNGFASADSLSPQDDE